MAEADVIRLAREVADRDKGDPYAGDMVMLTPAELVRLVEKVRAKALEDAAKVALAAPFRFANRDQREACAAAIRGMK